MTRYAACLVGLAVVIGSSAHAQLPLYFPETSPIGGGTNVIPFGQVGWVSNGYTFMQRIPASELDPANPIIHDMAFAPGGTGTWQCNNVRIALGHVPSPLPCPFFFPVGANLGSFLDLTVVWNSSQQGPFVWPLVQNTWSDMGFAAQGGTGFTWNGTDDIAFFITFQNSNVTGFNGGFNTARDMFGVAQAPFREYASGLNAAVSTGANCQEVGLRMRLMMLCPQSQWQVNQARAGLFIDGSSNTPCGPLHAVRCPGILSTVAAQSTLVGNPWDVAVTLSPPVPAFLTTTGGQFVNVDLTDPTLFFFGGGTFTNSFFPFQVPVASPQPIHLTSQLVVLDPTSGPDLLALSAVNWLEVINGVPLNGPAFDDGYLEYALGVPPLCGPSSISFAGSSYTSLFVCSNGLVTFGSGEFWWGPTPQDFLARPALAGLWADLDPSSGGLVSTVAQGGIVTTSFQSVPEHMNGLALNTFDMTFDTNTGSCGIYNYQVSPFLGAPFGGLVGLSPGPGSTDPGNLSWSSFVGLGAQTGPGAGAMIYEYTPSGGPFGFSSIEFPNSDASSFIVN